MAGTPASAPSPRACAPVACRRSRRGQQEGAGVRQPASVTDSGSRVRVAGAGRGFGRDTGRRVVRRCTRRGFGPREERLLPFNGPLTWIANGGRAPASRRGSVNPVGRWSSCPGSRHTGSPCRFAGTAATVRAQGRDGENDGPTRRAAPRSRAASGEASCTVWGPARCPGRRVLEVTASVHWRRRRSKGATGSHASFARRCGRRTGLARSPLITYKAQPGPVGLPRPRSSWDRGLPARKRCS